MIEGEHYCYIYPKDSNKSVDIKLLEGPYKDTTFRYGKVKFEEKNEQCYLLFNYDVIQSSVDKPKKLEKNEDFKNYIGNLLVEIMSSNIEQDIDDETRADHIEESDLQRGLS